MNEFDAQMFRKLGATDFIGNYSELGAIQGIKTMLVLQSAKKQGVGMVSVLYISSLLTLDKC